MHDSVGEEIRSDTVELDGNIAQKHVGIAHREEVQLLVVALRAQCVELSPETTDGIGLEGGFVGLIAVAPGRSAVVGHVGIDEFETRSLPSRE